MFSLGVWSGSVEAVVAVWVGVGSSLLLLPPQEARKREKAAISNATLRGHRRKALKPGGVAILRGSMWEPGNRHIKLTLAGNVGKNIYPESLDCQ